MLQKLNSQNCNGKIHISKDFKINKVNECHIAEEFTKCSLKSLYFIDFIIKVQIYL